MSGVRYTLDAYRADPPVWSAMGYGGEHVVVEFQGRRIHTNSMWYVGPTDEPDTATLVDRAHGYRGHCNCAQACTDFSDLTERPRA